MSNVVDTAETQRQPLEHIKHVAHDRLRPNLRYAYFNVQNQHEGK